MKKRILALLFVFCVILPLASCSKKKGDDASAGKTEEEITDKNTNKSPYKDGVKENVEEEQTPSTSKNPQGEDQTGTNPDYKTPDQENEKEENNSGSGNQSSSGSDIPYWQQGGNQNTGPITLPQGFSAGYARADMSPTSPVLTYDGAITANIHDPIQITCVAISDGSETALFYSLDLRQSWAALVTDSMNLVQNQFGQFGIAKDSMFFTATHNHSSPDAGSPNATGMAAWRKIYFEKLSEVTEGALRDLSSAEAFVGKSNTQKVSFVRRFITSDGKVTTDSTLNVTGYESQPDTELRTIRFDRKIGKDILLVNYQTHYGVATRYFGDVVSADFVHDLRAAAESQLGVHFAYYQGAAGCITFSAKKGDRVYATYMDAIPALMTTVKQAMNSESRAQTGPIQKAMTNYAGTVRKDDAATVALASSIYYEKDAAKQQELLANQSTFINAKAAENCVYRNKSLGATVSMPFTAISFGEIGFCSAPYEMFHQNGIQIRNASPFKMTFVCAYTNGSNSYVPAWECTPSGSPYNVTGCYENYVSRFVDGSGETFRDVILGLLNQCR